MNVKFWKKKTCYHCNHEVPSRSHSRGRETASARPGSTRFHRNFQMPWRHKLARLSCGISGEGRSFCDFVGVLSELFKCFISRSAMHGQWKNEPIRNTFITKTPRSCNGPAVRIEGKKPKGKLWLETKTKTNEKNIYNNSKKHSSHDISDIYFVTGFFKNTPTAVCSCCPSAA